MDSHSLYVWTVVRWCVTIELISGRRVRSLASIVIVHWVVFIGVTGWVLRSYHLKDVALLIAGSV